MLLTTSEEEIDSFGISFCFDFEFSFPIALFDDVIVWVRKVLLLLLGAACRSFVLGVLDVLFAEYWVGVFSRAYICSTYVHMGNREQ